MKELFRVFFDYTGITLCGTLMPMIELRKDRELVHQGYATHKFQM